ncbi:membrane-bound lytic murein transglycosylase D [Pontibacter akesuensis]|uniref:Membrane-bound lytic murein transglycosylase D n=2 Tax=Pontibacter akesuensis TaxID=388950 RepID=A0A1I7JBU6_9BACT|nr:hypothetical protein GCM10007389_25800 [Pontibacter akesuensis]SFU82571.1 membrane-bound lytic murein transglycosylase D [Pontibacter akesuensis]
MAQVVVPKNIYFADIHLKISDGAQAAIQKKVDALHRNQNYFKMKVDLADAYFPIIERVFKEEGVPDDFKYLALQESGLIGDAVSTSNAVGYWQFKREAALDFNLRMDRAVDERRHIVEASRGAAKYFKRSNGYYNNWLNSLLSYYLGYTGAKAYSKPSDNGARNMDVTERSNDYIITFLAHKVAYDNFVGKANPPAVALKELRANPGQSLSDIALATKTDYAELERYNKWLLGSSIPSDKDYYVMVPVRNGSGFDSGMLASAKTDAPVRQTTTSRGAAASLVKQNNLNAIVAREGDTKDKLALQAGISTRRFLKYNDMHNFDKIVPGSSYYIEQKRASANTEFHVVQPGETMQLISQHYGVRLNYLLFKNRMKRNEMPVPGRVLWLQNRRPAHTPVEIRDLNKQQAATAATSKTQRTEPAAAAKEPVTPQTKNVFTRFIESLKGETKEEAQPQEEPMATTKTTPVATSKPAPVKQEAEIVAEVAVKEVAVAPAEEAPVSPAPVVKRQTAVLYPAKTATAKASEGTPKAGSATEPFPAPASKTAPATTSETFPADTTAFVFEEDSASEEELTFEEEGIEEEAAAATFPAKTTSTPLPKATAATPAPAQPQTGKPTTHIVKQGETLYGISRMYAVTINDLTEWNKLGDAPLKLGQELLIAEPLQQPETKSVFRDEEDPEALPATLLSTNSSYHTVAAGETLYQLSRKYNVSLDQLRQWNSLTDNNLKLGQELRVKAPAASPAPAKEAAPAASSTSGSVYHTVASGESMYQISRQYGVTIKDIMEWNKKPDFSVSVGEKLLIRKK